MRRKSPGIFQTDLTKMQQATKSVHEFVKIFAIFKLFSRKTRLVFQLYEIE